MAINLSAYRSALVDGGVRPNQFKVIIGNIANLAVTPSLPTNHSLLIEAASLPGQTLGIATSMFRGREFKFAGDRRFENWQITVINTGFNIYNFMTAWMNAIHKASDLSGELNPNSYTASLNVQQLARTGESVIKQYNFVNCWPVSVAPITLGFDQNDQIEKFQVDFALDYYEEAVI